MLEPRLRMHLGRPAIACPSNHAFPSSYVPSSPRQVTFWNCGTCASVLSSSLRDRSRA